MSCPTQTLLISKIDGIKVVQTGESKLSATNNHVHSHKIGIGFIGSGSNRTVDLGRGIQKHSMTIEVEGRADKKAILNVCQNKRFCSVTDKWKGRLKAYVESYEMIDNDEHMNITRFVITLALQDSSPSIFNSFFAFFIGITGNLLSDTISLIPSSLTTADGMIITRGLSQLAPLSQVSHAVSNISTPYIMSELLKEIHSRKYIVDATEYTPFKIYTYFSKNESQIERKIHSETEKVHTFMNYVFLTEEIKLFKDYEFTSQDDFRVHIDNVLKRIEILNIKDKYDIFRKVKDYAGTKSYRKIIDTEQKGNALINIVFERYGNLDLLDDIKLLNIGRDFDEMYQVRLYE